MSKRCGAFWKRSYTKDGKEVVYMSGVVDMGVAGEMNVALFRNDRKEEDKHPDYVLVRSDKKGKDNDEPGADDDDGGPF